MPAAIAGLALGLFAGPALADCAGDACGQVSIVQEGNCLYVVNRARRATVASIRVIGGGDQTIMLAARSRARLVDLRGACAASYRLDWRADFS
jgi:hypothetical protein